jgi:Icc-related predicted phosphoesterase
MIKKIARNIHKITFDKKTAEIALLSDIHWDNPHCDRKLLKQHLDYCLEKKIPVIVIGDMFCLMQGRGDNRRNKSDIRPEHNNAKYLDSVIETAVEWFSPYASVLKLITYGNHETGIIKYQETDVLQRFVDIFNYKNNTKLMTGGYGGWIVYTLQMRDSLQVSFKHKYFHGSGGGGIVTKGAINLTRALETYEEFDIFSMGHIHENSCRTDVREYLEMNGRITQIRKRYIHHCITGTYKEEYEDGAAGWHIERGAPAKPLGGRILKLSAKESNKNGLIRMADSYNFPI